MTPALFYSLAGLALFFLALHGFFVKRHLIRRIIALNIMGSGVFLLFCGMGAGHGGPVDPVAQALVITGIVVAVATSALALALAVRLHHETGATALDQAAHRADSDPACR